MHEMLDNMEVVLFDMDGSLVDSVWVWEQIDRTYLEQHDIHVPQSLQRDIDGLSFSEVALYFKSHFELQDSVEEIKLNLNHMAYDKYAYDVMLKNDVLEFLDECRINGIRLGIATSNSIELVHAMLYGHKISDYFQYILTCNEVGRNKPAPDVYINLANCFEVEPNKCLVFEDTVTGIQSGKNAGMRVCAVEDAYSMIDAQKKKLMADYYITSYCELLNL